MLAAPSCLDESQIWAFVDGSLDADDKAFVRAHLDACSDCRAVVAALARAAPAVTASREPTEVRPPSFHDEPRAAGEALVGQLVAGKYLVERVLGSGGMGYVVAARHVQLGTRVALKFLLPNASHGPEIRARFLREARAAARITSPHVARIFDVHTLDDGEPFIVMELLAGNDLEQELASRGRLPVAEAARLVLEAIVALGEAHRSGIVHRDLKPANLFLSRTGTTTTLKVLDFGISKNLLPQDDDFETSDARLIGTPRYMAPEQLNLGRDVSPRTDIWALGVVLHRLVSGELPFAPKTVREYCAAVVTDAPRPLPGLPTGFAGIVLRCLAKEPADRFATVEELAAALGPFGDGREPSQPRGHRGRARLTALAASIVLAIVVGVVARKHAEAPARAATPGAVSVPVVDDVDVAPSATAAEQPATAPTPVPLPVVSTRPRVRTPAPPPARHQEFGSRR